MKTITLLLPLALLAGCDSVPQSTPVPPSTTRLVAPTSDTDLDQHNTEKVRIGETLKAYPVGRVVDPTDPNLMHESHVVYRREADPSWNLQPNAPTVVPLGPVLSVADPARMPNALPAELEHKIAEQNQLMSSLIEQNEALATELTKLSKEISEIRRKTAENAFKGGE